MSVSVIGVCIDICTYREGYIYICIYMKVMKVLFNKEKCCNFKKGFFGKNNFLKLFF